MLGREEQLACGRAQGPGHVLQPRHGDVSLPALEIGQEALRDSALLRELAAAEFALLAEATHRGADRRQQDLVFPSHEVALYCLILTGASNIVLASVLESRYLAGRWTRPPPRRSCSSTPTLRSTATG